ncbi:nucleoside triphosphate pyrophosphatase [Nocardioides zeae]|uniref:Nucleoside triphosphate pyrophosphatase n=1 Tax=Nocardioides imazamoxiresistens TaxID=3231893 RepID=A0ABU3PZH5_9ACTN|nr:nucleoside triphosphate pyrophosphatase [Nocardioides zeae]MDT9594529.1 nucleoside triphosphate pyrophosphatase [Nocardioides zeae]
MPTLVLASASPARLRTLRTAGLDPLVVVSGVDESVADGLGPRELSAELARLKRDAVAARSDELPVDAVVLGCDSVLEVDGEAHGKPGTAEVAVERWHRMRGRTGVLHTGHAVLDLASGRGEVEVGSTLVRFAEPSDAEIEAYVATGEPLAVAGGFTLEGLGAAFVAGVDGDPHNVVGVSVPLLRVLLARLGHAWPDLWRPRDAEAG